MFGVEGAVLACLDKLPVGAVIDRGGVHRLGESDGQGANGPPGVLSVRRQRLDGVDPGLDVHVPFDEKCPRIERAYIQSVVIGDLQRPDPQGVEAVEVRKEPFRLVPARKGRASAGNRRLGFVVQDRVRKPFAPRPDIGKQFDPRSVRPDQVDAKIAVPRV